MEKIIEFGQPYVDEDDKSAILKAFESKWILNGPNVRMFEELFKSYIGSDYACGVSSCTAGMHAVFCVLGIQEGDEIIVPAFSFAANGLAILQVGAIPAFVDVDDLTLNIDPNRIEAAITERTKAIVLVHYAGLSAEMNSILEIAKKYDLFVVEDAAHALGSRYKEDYVGTFGDATVFSFGPLKMLVSAGMGGMVTTNNKDIDSKLRKFISYGMDKSMWNRKKDKKPWQYNVADLGHNFRMMDVSAAMGISQLNKLDWILSKRRHISEAYNQELKGVKGLIIPFEPDDHQHAYLYYVIRIKEGESGVSRDELAQKLHQENIKISVHWDPPLHLHTLYNKYGYQCGDFPVSERAAKEVLSLPMHLELSESDVRFVSLIIRDTLSQKLYE